TSSSTARPRSSASSSARLTRQRTVRSEKRTFMCRSASVIVDDDDRGVADLAEAHAPVGRLDLDEEELGVLANRIAHERNQDRRSPRAGVNLLDAGTDVGEIAARLGGIASQRPTEPHRVPR